MAIDVELEHDVLAHALRDTAFLSQAVPVLRRHHFSSRPLAWIWTTLQTGYSATREIPTGAVWKAHIDRAYADEAERDGLIDVLVRLRRRKRGAPKSALEEIRRFVRMASLRGGMEGLFDGLDDDDLDGAEKSIVEALAEVRGVGFLVEPTEWALDADARLAAYMAPAATCRIPLPMDGLNFALNGGMPPGHVGLVTAYTNVGKSTFAVDVGFTALMHGEKGQVVIHVCTEESRPELEARYDARFTGISRDKLQSGKLTLADQDLFRAKFARRAKDIGGRLILQEITPGGRVDSVRAIVEEARGKYHDVPFLVIVDSLDHLTPGRKYDNANQEVAATYWQFWALVRDPTLAPIAGWATTNAKQTFEKKKPTERAIGGTFEKSKLASVVIGLSEIAKTVKGTTGTTPVAVLLSKNRVGAVKNWTLTADADLGICKFTQVAGSGHPMTEDEA